MDVVRENRRSRGALVVVCICMLSACTWWSIHPSHIETPSSLTVVNAHDAGTTLAPIQNKINGDEIVHPYSPPPLFWSQSGIRYRAIHSISVWNTQEKMWVPISPNLTEDKILGSDGYGVDGITAIAHSNQTWYVGTLVGGVIVKLPYQNWLRVTSGLPERTVTAVAIAPGDLDGRAAAVGFGGYNSATPNEPGHVYTTVTGGSSWLDVTGDLPNEPVEALQYQATRSPLKLSVKMSGSWYVMTNESGHWSKR